jgi:uncharacterized membrane protein
VEVPHCILYEIITFLLESLLNDLKAVIAIALLFATFAFSIIILRNFGRGLKDARTHLSRFSAYLR